MVESGIGCTIGASFTWLAGQHYNVAVKPISDIKRSRYLYARLPQDEKPSKAVWDFITFLQDYSEEISRKYR